MAKKAKPESRVNKESDQQEAIDRATDYLLQVYMRGFRAPLEFVVTRAVWERAREILEDEDGHTGFLSFQPLDRRSVYLNCDHLLACLFLWEPAAFGLGERWLKPCEELQAFVLGSTDPFTAVWIEGDSFIDINMTLENYWGQGARFITFMDQDGEVIAIRLDDLVYLEYPSHWDDELDDDGD